MKKFLLFIFLLFLSFSSFSQLNVKIDFYPNYKAEGLFKSKVYTVFILHFYNKGKKSLKIGESFILTTKEGKKYFPHPAPWLRKDIRDKFGVKEKFIWIGKLKPKGEQDKIVVFEDIGQSTSTIYLNIYGLYPHYILRIEFKKFMEGRREKWREIGRKWVKK